MSNNQAKNLKKQEMRSLAAEYALGILEGEDLRVAREQFDTNPKFQKEFALWQDKFDPMLQEFPSQDAPAAVWQGIDEKLFGGKDEQRQSLSGLSSAITFWRGLSFVSLAVVAGLISTIVFAPSLLQINKPVQTQLLASLGANSEKASFIVQRSGKAENIKITPVNFPANANKDAELWLIPADGTPRSLGIFANDGTTGLNISAKYVDLFSSGALLAVSIEPLGGAPDGKPTGPIIATGKII